MHVGKVEEVTGGQTGNVEERTEHVVGDGGVGGCEGGVSGDDDDGVSGLGSTA